MSADAAHDAAAEAGPCPFCGGPARGAFTVADRNRELSDERFSYRVCEACGTYSLIDVPSDLGRFYPAAYYELPNASQLEGLLPVEAHKVELISRYATSGRLVEVGPGAGVFAYAARRAGFDVTALEMDERAAEHVRGPVGARAVVTDDPADELARMAPSQVVAMWHVIEHLPDPAAMLEAVAANLLPGGVLALAAPNPEAVQFRVLGPRWAHVDAPRHLFLIPLEALSARAGSLGLRRVFVTTSDPAGRHWNRFGWERGMRRRPAQGAPSKALAVAALGLTLALRPIEHTGLRGAAYTAVFVKEDS